MAKMNERNIFTVNNKYQMEIVTLITTPLLTIAAAVLIAAYFMTKQVDQLIVHQSYAIIGPAIAQWFLATICFVFLTFVIFLALAFRLAHDMVNPFGRMLAEVDETLITGEKRNIQVRPTDFLALEVVERFNKLIAKMK